MSNFSSSSKSAPIYKVALPVPLRALFDYASNESLRELAVGDRVKVSFGNRELLGIVYEVVNATTANSSSDGKRELKRILDVGPSHTRLTKELIQLSTWLAHYYHHPIGETLLSLVPPYLRQNIDISTEEQWVHTTEGKGLQKEHLKRSPKQQDIHRALLDQQQLSDEDCKRLGFSSSALKALKEKGLIKKVSKPIKHADHHKLTTILAETPKELNDEQARAVSSVTLHNFTCSLLHGITGSGKTEVYLQLVAKIMQTGRQALVLIPEIGLSPQTVERFRQRFAVKLVELHSGVSDAQRARNWVAAMNGEARIIVGTRLAALCPLAEPGIIIIDEEHDSSFKQQDGLRYSARDASIYRAKQNNIPVILGSATPSLESLKLAQEHHYQHLVLRQRAAGATVPEIDCLDLRDRALQAGLCSDAIKALKESLARNEQALVFQNRRGFAPMLLCHSCGWVAECNNCSANMTLHQQAKRLHCHHCDRKATIPKTCPRCQSTELDSRGIGTEQLESTLKQLFPETDVLRIDRDTTSSKKAMKNVLEKVHSGKPAILIGTQMIAKGHHFAKLSTVLVVDADYGFLNPDFRAIEKMGQLLMQVSGRAGRESTQGRVLIQTHRPEHPLLEMLIQRGYTAFARAIQVQRQANKQVPYSYAAVFRAESKRADNALQLLEVIRNAYFNHFPPSLSMRILGPTPAAIEKVQDRFRFELYFNSDTRKELHTALHHLVASVDKHALSRRVRWSIDVDPIEG